MWWLCFDLQGKGVDYLVLWLDCDKEGENICFEVIDCVKSVMNRNVPGEVTYMRGLVFTLHTKYNKCTMYWWQVLGEQVIKFPDWCFL